MKTWGLKHKGTCFIAFRQYLKTSGQGKRQKEIKKNCSKYIRKQRISFNNIINIPDDPRTVS